MTGPSPDIPQPTETEIAGTPERPKSPWESLVPIASSPPANPRKDLEAEKLREDMERGFETEKRRESLTEASLTVHIDKAKLAEIKTVRPDRYATDEENKAQQLQLEQLLDRLKKLPERLDFKPGITLIVGENGSGKSTLAKALFLMAEFQDQLDFDKDREFAHAFVFEPGFSMPGLRVWLNQAGLAPELAQTMDPESFQTGKRIGGDESSYMDFPETIGYQAKNEQEHVFSLQEKGEIASGWDTHQSHRQTVDRLIFDNLKRGKAHNPKPGIFFLDEPETGMSPRRQKQLPKEISECTPDGSIVIVPTNSVVLFDSDLPRIDLDFPERGIHRPNQYPSS